MAKSNKGFFKPKTKADSIEENTNTDESEVKESVEETQESDENTPEELVEETQEGDEDTPEESVKEEKATEELLELMEFNKVDHLYVVHDVPFIKKENADAHAYEVASINKEKIQTPKKITK